MKIVRVYTPEEERRLDIKNVPALVNAVMDLRKQYPDMDNQFGEIDRRFEKIHKVRVISGTPCSVIWENDQDYTAFLLKWTP